MTQLNLTQLKTFRIGDRCFYKRTGGLGGHKPMTEGIAVMIVQVSETVITVRTDDARRLTVGKSSLWELPIVKE